MKKKIVLSFVLVCSLVLSIISYKSVCSASLLASDNVEALSCDVDYEYYLPAVNITCGQYEGLCWALDNEWYDDPGIVGKCTVFTGDMADWCKGFSYIRDEDY